MLFEHPKNVKISGMNNHILVSQLIVQFNKAKQNQKPKTKENKQKKKKKNRTEKHNHQMTNIYRLN